MIRKKIINPTSNLIICIVSTIITLFLGSNPIVYTESLPWWQKILYFLFQYSFLTDVKLIYVVLFIWFLWSFFYNFVIESKDDEIKSLTLENEKLKRNLESEAGLLLSRYSDLTKFKIKDILQENIKRYVDGTKIIESAQLYKYTYTPRKESTLIKVEFNGGFVKEGININSIMQNYYTVPTNVLEKVETIVRLYQHIFETKEESEEWIFNIFNAIDEIATPIINSLKENLKEKTKFNDEDADVYTVLMTTIALLYEDDSDSIEGPSAYDSEIRIVNEEIFKDLDAELELRNKKRTGILESILRKDYSVFKHDGANDKKGRAYISKCISLNEEKYVLLISCNPYISERNDWKDVLLSLVSELEEILNQCFEAS